MGNILWSKTAFEVAVAEFIATCHIRKGDGSRILPAIMSDNYFTLMPGEKRCITIEFDEKLLQDDTYELIVEPYN
ncbi:MAG: hypothetical protein IJ442_06225 [Bacteroidaceae bacterium]|nr:hypothetical protein [Bacteroidaceae bacterium]